MRHSILTMACDGNAELYVHASPVWPQSEKPTPATPMLAQCRASVADGGSALKQHWLNDSCFQEKPTSTNTRRSTMLQQCWPELKHHWVIYYLVFTGASQYTNAVAILGHRRRRWASIVTALSSYLLCYVTSLRCHLVELPHKWYTDPSWSISIVTIICNILAVLFFKFPQAQVIIE